MELPPPDIRVNFGSFQAHSLEGALPWWLRGKESACQRRKHGLDPWSRKITRALGQLSLCTATVGPVLQSLGTTATEAHVHPRAALCNRSSHRREKPAPRN